MRLHQPGGSGHVDQPVTDRWNASVANSLLAAPSMPGSFARRRHPRRPAREQVGHLGVDGEARERVPTRGLLEQRPAVVVDRVTRVRLGHREQTLGVADPTRDTALERQRHQHHLPAAVDLTDAPLVAHLDAVVERHVRALAGQRADGLQLEAGRRRRDEEEREAAVLRRRRGWCG